MPAVILKIIVLLVQFILSPQPLDDVTDRCRLSWPNRFSMYRHRPIGALEPLFSVEFVTHVIFMPASLDVNPLPALLYGPVVGRRSQHHKLVVEEQIGQLGLAQWFRTRLHFGDLLGKIAAGDVFQSFYQIFIGNATDRSRSRGLGIEEDTGFPRSSLFHLPAHACGLRLLPGMAVLLCLLPYPCELNNKDQFMLFSLMFLLSS